jgi:hypothetical protein
MKLRPLLPLLALAAALPLCVAAQKDSDRRADRALRALSHLADRDISDLNKSVAKFSDATKPGTLRVDLPSADIRIAGHDSAEVIVASDLAEKGRGEVDDDGFRRLDDEVTFEVTEKNNVITIALTGPDRWQGHGSDFTILVPRGTNVVIDGDDNHGGGDLVIEGVEGDLDVSTMNGDVVLRDVVGAAVVNNMNGEISAAFKAAPTKAVSLVSMNGEIDLRLPADTKANLKMSTHNGSIRTNFPGDALKSKTESSGYTYSGHAPHARAAAAEARAMAEALRGDVERLRDNAEKLREAAGEDAEKAREAAAIAAEVSRKVAREVSREVARNVSREVRAAVAAAPEAPATPATPVAARAPRAPRVPGFGGKTVTGTLNGGGVDITLSSMNGTITVRQVK